MLDKAEILVVADGVEEVLFVHPSGVEKRRPGLSSSAALA
jgi:hypothetical protein